MDKILAPIKGRILQLIDYKGVDKIKFLEKNKLSASNYRSKSLYSEVGGDVIAKISSLFPDINVHWLVTGEGKMLLSDVKKSNIKSDIDDYKEKYYKKLEELDICKSKIIELQEELFSQQGNATVEHKPSATGKNVKTGS